MNLNQTSDNSYIALIHPQQHKRSLSCWEKVSHYFWGPNPLNTLRLTYFTTPKVHSNLRVFFMLFHVAVWIWTALSIGVVYNMAAYLTLWGFTICTLYFILVNCVNKSPDNSTAWKITYVLGELGATLEFLICPFFFAFLFPVFLTTSPPLDSVILQVCLHFFCPVFIWIDTILNGIAFPRNHVWFLVIVCVLYPPNNYAWTMAWGKPVYPVMDWKTYMTYVYIAGAVVLGFVGFYVGILQYGKKKDKKCMDAKNPEKGPLFARML